MAQPSQPTQLWPSTSKALAAVEEIGLKAQADPQGVLNSQPLLHSQSAVKAGKC